MASRTTVTLVDDLDGSTADETVPFGLDSSTYEIDLSSEHADQLRAALEQYVAAGRRTGGRRSSTATASPKNSTPPTGSSRARNQEVRAWANSHGVAIGDRGRIPINVVAAFEAGDPSRLTEPEPGAADDQARAGTEETQRESAPLPTAAAAVSATSSKAEAGSPSEAVAETPAGAEETRGRDGLTASERETIRAWAVNEGIEVKTRGQLKKDLVANYLAWSARHG